MSETERSEVPRNCQGSESGVRESRPGIAGSAPPGSPRFRELRPTTEEVEVQNRRPTFPSPKLVQQQLLLPHTAHVDVELRENYVCNTRNDQIVCASDLLR